MPAIFSKVMEQLYGLNIWDDFVWNDYGEDVQGWNGTHPSLKRLPENFSEQIIVDLGVWKGQSTITLAGNLRQNSINGVVIAVDTFLGSPEHWNNDADSFARHYGFPKLYNTFMSNVARCTLIDYVVPLPQTSTSACTILKSKGIYPTLVHIDAAHEYREALADISDYWNLLQPGGVMIGDDYHETWPGVVRAAGEFSAAVGRPLYIDGPKFILHKAT